jgi:hypothetical protein
LFNTVCFSKKESKASYYSIEKSTLDYNHRTPNDR